MAKPYRVLFVCMGNICRSPIAEAVARTLAQRQGLGRDLDFDSAGTHGHYHAGEAPDPRARRVAARRGYDLSRLRARAVIDADFDRSDRILAMDEANLASLRRQCPEESRSKLGLFLDYAAGLGISEVPDPYYGAESGFERVIDLCELAARGLLADLAGRRGGR
ncbi:MAG: Low molecular weight protein-tyrosine-phosphatase YfkJ [Accumulibacter sp.]|uniref:low molecular weight protein-tyrosine-phosphatase n=1 Tax=Accumulibacter sp. TaxID=2053492 RepID=UPI001222C024|nr:low molecular weight protein-tyrosine-phosphatase [Accumulibacter sp.]TLD43913.1 MAG: Low molecular weight protein-tyrosine-phosphatase YfkJ [Accumulibacter sp.]